MPGPSTSASLPAQGERASGVIVKVERLPGAANPAAPGGTAPAGAVYRLTVNTNDVWRDWARDQARFTDRGPAATDAARGVNSVATAGEPVDRNNLVVVDVGPETRVETRFRSPDDETSRGTTMPEATRLSGGAGGRVQAAKPVQFRADDLKPGLFVEVDFKQAAPRDRASTVAVIRPIGGPETPPDAGVQPRGPEPR
jgi:hypothetical protein